MQQRAHIFRRKYYLPGSLQPRLIRLLIGLLVIVIAVSATAFYLLADQELADEFYKAHQTLSNTREMFLPWLITVNILAIVLAIIFAVFPSHKVAGPVYHIEKDLKRIGQGEFPATISVRRGDVLKEFAERLDNSMQSVKEHMTIVKRDLRELDEYIGSLDKSAGITEQQLEELRRKVARSLSNMNYFKINDDE